MKLPKNVLLFSIAATFGLLVLLSSSRCGSGKSPTASQTQPQSEPGRYYYKDQGFSIKPPSDWSKSDAPAIVGAFTIKLDSPLEASNDPYRENVIISVFTFTGQSGIDTFLFSFLGKYFRLRREAEQQGRQISIDEGTITIDNRGAQWAIYPEVLNGNFQTMIYECYMVNGLKGYVINFSAATDKYSKFKPVFDEIVKSFKFE